MTHPALQRIDYLEATLLMFVRHLAGEHDGGFPAAIKELAHVARQAQTLDSQPAHPRDLARQTIQNLMGVLNEINATEQERLELAFMMGWQAACERANLMSSGPPATTPTTTDKAT